MKRAAWAPPLTRALIRIRVALVVSMACGFWIFFAPMRLPLLVRILLPPVLALAIAGVLVALEQAPERGTGRADEGRR